MRLRVNGPANGAVHRARFTAAPPWFKTLCAACAAAYYEGKERWWDPADEAAKSAGGRFSRVAVRGYLRLADKWGLSAEERIDLLGAAVNADTLRTWAADQTRIQLTNEQLLRISLLLGIFKGLERLWRRAPTEADAWVRRPRGNGPFKGSTPLQFMRRGGVPALVTTRAYVDGIIGGQMLRED